jgi:uncharacterized membrane protein
VPDNVTPPSEETHVHSRLHNMPPKNRVEALVDGIFSVAMTLLVLGVKLPDGLQLSSNADMLRHFASVEFSFGIYVISFCVLAMFWIAHHFQFRYAARIDHTLLWINLIFLLLVTLIPFTTSLIASYGTLELPVLLYAANQLLLFLMLAFHLRRLRHVPELTTSEFTPHIGNIMWRRLRVVCIVPILAMIVAPFSPYWGIRVFYLLGVLHFVPNLLDRVGGIKPIVDRRRQDE